MDPGEGWDLVFKEIQLLLHVPAFSKTSGSDFISIIEGPFVVSGGVQSGWDDVVGEASQDSDVTLKFWRPP